MAHALRDNGQGRRILIADDEALVRMTLRMLLSANGFAVTEASSGEEAMQTYFASPQNFDALILDINIGALSGDEAFRQILARHPKAKAILLSGGINPPPTCAGACFLQKPFENAELLQMIREMTTA